MTFVLSFMEIVNQVRMFMLKCLWVSHSKLWMGPEWSSRWRRPFMDFVKVHEHFGSILPKGSKPVDWNNPGLILVSLYEPKWFDLSLCWQHHLLEQRYSGYQWLSNAIAWVWRRPYGKMTSQGFLDSHWIGTQKQVCLKWSKLDWSNE